MGYCGLDRQRGPLSGDEIRACWDARPEPAETGTVGPVSPAFTRTSVPRLDFVEVAPTGSPRPGQRADRPAATPAVEPVTVVVVPRWSLWEDAEV
jgi:hypothetical protein